MREAARHALGGNPGPVYIGIRDIFEEELPDYEEPKILDQPLALPLSRPAPTMPTLTRYSGPGGPIILVGNGIHLSGPTSLFGRLRSGSYCTSRRTMALTMNLRSTMLRVLMLAEPATRRRPTAPVRPRLSWRRRAAPRPRQHVSRLRRCVPVNANGDLKNASALLGDIAHYAGAASLETILVVSNYADGRPPEAIAHYEAAGARAIAVPARAGASRRHDRLWGSPARRSRCAIAMGDRDQRRLPSPRPNRRA